MAEWMKRNGVHGYLTQPTEANNGYVGNNEAMRREHPGPRGGGFGRYDQGTSQPLQYMPHPGRMVREPMMSTGGKGKGSQPDSAIADKVRSQRPAASVPAPWASPTPAAPAARPAAPTPAPVAATPRAVPEKPFVKPPVDMRPMYGGAGGRRGSGGGSSSGGGSRRTAGPSAPSGVGQAPIRGQVEGGIEDASRMASFATPRQASPSPAQALPRVVGRVPNAPYNPGRGGGTVQEGGGDSGSVMSNLVNWAGSGFPMTENSQRAALSPGRQAEMRSHPGQAGVRAGVLAGSAIGGAMAAAPAIAVGGATGLAAGGAMGAVRGVGSALASGIANPGRIAGVLAGTVLGGAAGRRLGGTQIAEETGAILGGGLGARAAGGIQRGVQAVGASRAADQGRAAIAASRAVRAGNPSSVADSVSSGRTAVQASQALRARGPVAGGTSTTPSVSTPARAPAVSTPAVATPVAVSPAPGAGTARRAAGGPPLPRGGGSVMANATRAPRLNTGGNGVRLQARTPVPVPGDAARAGSTRRAAGGPPPAEVRVEREPEVPFHDFMGGITHGMLSTTDGGGMTRGGTNPPPATTRHGYGLSNVRM